MTQAVLTRQSARSAGRDGLARAIAFAILLAVFALTLWGTVMWLDDMLMALIAACLAILPPLTAMAPILNEAR
jgi:4-amino-4-deoxy-L-arabinose transferase-like glycosyltransferase